MTHRQSDTAAVDNDEECRDDLLRMAGLRAGQDRDEIVARLTPLELARHDLAALEQLKREYDAGRTSLPISSRYTLGLLRLIDLRRASVDRVRAAERS